MITLIVSEFQSRRSSYYWLCNALDLYTPVQWEYARLNMSYTVTSKRKILKLIQNRVVSDYDDPRLFTLTGLRRRGIPPEAINKFVAKMGLTVAQTTVDPHLFDSVIRDHLNINAPRTMVVLEPLKLIISNYADLNLEPKIKVPNFPTDPSKESFHEVNVDSIVYIERSDYKDKGEKGFRRLTKEQTVGLKYLGLVLKVVEEHKNAEGGLTELVVYAETANDQNKPKAFIHWVCKPLFAEVRLFEQLFKSRNPDDKTAIPGGFLTDINKNTLTIHSNCAIDEYLTKSAVYDRYQFERIGFFAVDPDSETSKHLVFNRTVSLKEDAGKK
uniref:Glutaminyl-tRNA synthetase n=1 Tax=Panagrolaimus sp. JU765 TaxID=591449 RepID=A0AC34QYF3_9BILA